MRTLHERIIEGNKRLVHIAGNSTETPPTENIATGSQFAVTDGGEIKMYDETEGWNTFAKFDTGAASVGTGLGGGMLGGGTNPGSDPGNEETPAGGDGE